ncbi:PREDICTED: CD2 antigen cytoplasmic tail-binding protein 2 homolog [Dinoponera quadriceps]|uniref:CD2 antigen cytoplasmic tail-binding protein 2 homolog n=1 Tax=Dinoponera quadriceps TaxID=609295 RepID=A0A6P3XKM6_DINQU|nr:PREDICTED: CD2 antigen cytoplasmic tail-binding protein 2 homolog [Dinoponera quadriceps]
MSKRKLDNMIENEFDKQSGQPLKNSLDSDEDDDETNEDAYNVMNEDEFEGTEDGPSVAETNVGFTAFNMKEELEEGHFDKDGHYLWNKEKQIRDNWLDNIDWIQVKPSSTTERKDTKSDEAHGLGDSDSDEGDIMFDSTPLYKQMLEYIKPGETVSKALCRLGKGKKKLTTAERWKKKKECKTLVEEDQNSVNITKLTELANELLTRTGNMDIYQETYEQITKKVEQANKHAPPSKQEAELDMYADDFDEKEKAKLDDTDSGADKAAVATSEEKSSPSEEDIMWELKWSQDDDAEIHGPHTSQQMHAWANEGYFKKGAWVRRSGQQNQFYSAARVDFELYL